MTDVRGDRVGSELLRYHVGCMQVDAEDQVGGELASREQPRLSPKGKQQRSPAPTTHSLSATPGQAADGSRTVVKLDAEAALAAVRSAYRPADSAAFVMIHDKAASARMVTVPAHVPA